MVLEKAKSIGDKVWSDRPYLRDLINQLFFKDPVEILKSIPSVYAQLEKDPSFEEKIRQVVEQHRYGFQKARWLDTYDAVFSAAQLASLAATYGADFPAERIAEILEALPKVPYIYSYGKRTGAAYAAALTLYELLSLIDPTNILDILPAYTLAEIYSMYRDLKKEMKR
jgi:hypothetical protein